MHLPSKCLELQFMDLLAILFLVWKKSQQDKKAEAAKKKAAKKNDSSSSSATPTKENEVIKID